MSAPPAPDDYFRAVERAFLGFRGGGLVLSPADWDLVCRWEERGIPLDAVLSGIRATFSGKIRVSSRMPLGECSRAVEAALDARRVRRTGAAAPAETAPEAGTGLERLTARLRSWSPGEARLANPELAGDLVAAARNAAAQIERLGKSTNDASASAGETVQAIENDLVNRLQAALPDAAREEIETEVRNKLAPYRTRMPESTWRKTFDRAVRRRVGEFFGLGPLFR